jgi:hypothetical protein
MADRTLVICACLVIIAVLLFAGTALLLMYKGAPGQNSAGESFQKNDEKRISAPHNIQSENNVPPKFYQGNSPMRPDKPEDQEAPGRCGCPCSMKQGNDPDHFRPDSLGSQGPESQAKGRMMQGNTQDRSAPNQSIQGSDQKREPTEHRGFLTV